MLTANTITDDQIRRLKRMTIGMPVKSESDQKLIDDCVTALTDRRAMAFQMPGVSDGVSAARQRCADVINAARAQEDRITGPGPGPGHDPSSGRMPG